MTNMCKIHSCCVLSIIFQVSKEKCTHIFWHLGGGFFSDVSSMLIISLTDDLSVNKDTQQYKTPINCPTCVSNNAVDRNITTCARMEVIGNTSSDKNTWWYVDLGGIYNVYNIRIQFKDYTQYSKYS